MTPAHLFHKIVDAFSRPRGTIIDGISFVDYAAIPALNWSTLKEMERSPRHFAHRQTAPRDDNARLLIGRATHTAVLEPDRFLVDYALFEGERRAGNVWEDFKSANTARTILKRAEYERALCIRNAVRAHPVAAKYLASGVAERTLLWVDAGSGLPCKGRLDWTTFDLVLVDLKTTNDIDMRRFGNVAARFGYHAQLAWYLRGLEACGEQFHAAKLIVAEADAPHDVGVFDVDNDLLFAGGEQCDELVARVKECTASGEWPGRYGTETPLQLPSWWYALDDEADFVVKQGEQGELVAEGGA